MVLWGKNWSWTLGILHSTFFTVLAQAHEETRHMVPPSVIPAIQEEGKVLNSIFQNVFSSCEEKWDLHHFAYYTYV